MAADGLVESEAQQRASAAGSAICSASRGALGSLIPAAAQGKAGTHEAQQPATGRSTGPTHDGAAHVLDALTSPLSGALVLATWLAALPAVDAKSVKSLLHALGSLHLNLVADKLGRSASCNGVVAQGTKRLSRRAQGKRWQPAIWCRQVLGHTCTHHQWLGCLMRQHQLLQALHVSKCSALDAGL